MLRNQATILLMNLILTLGLIQGCGRDAGMAELKLVHGKTVGSQYPAVRKIRIQNNDGSWGTCTSTFISDREALTAAHCLSDAERVELARSFWFDVKAQSWRIHARYHEQDGIQERFQNDLALITFPAETNEHFFDLAPRPAQIGDVVEMVGFGSDDPLRPVGSSGISSLWGDSKKRAGSNSIAQRIGNVVVTADVDMSGDSSVYSQVGDSGGPALLNGQLLGIMVGNRTDFGDGTAKGYIYDLLSPDGKAFLFNID